jgi:hypothetical protein
MCNNSLDHEYAMDDLLQRVRLNCGDDERLYQVISDGLKDLKSEGHLKACYH